VIVEYWFCLVPASLNRDRQQANTRISISSRCPSERHNKRYRHTCFENIKGADAPVRETHFVSLTTRETCRIAHFTSSGLPDGPKEQQNKNKALPHAGAHKKANASQHSITGSFTV
jgi:hypothetical protein